MKIIIICAVIVLSGSMAHAQKVKVVSNPGTDFSQYKTFAWDRSMLANPLIKQLIMTAVNLELTAKGLVTVENEPDLIITALLSTESDLAITNPSWAPGLNSLATGIPDRSQTWPVTKGTLAIHIFDFKSKAGVWRGTAIHTLETGPTGDRMRDAKVVEKPIRKAVRKCSSTSPPHGNSESLVRLAWRKRPQARMFDYNQLTGETRLRSIKSKSLPGRFRAAQSVMKGST